MPYEKSQQGQWGYIGLQACAELTELALYFRALAFLRSEFLIA
jgi:hypothetical protein